MTVVKTYTLKAKLGTLLTLYKISRMLPTISRDLVKCQIVCKRLVAALYKPGNKAYTCSNSHYEGFQESSTANYITYELPPLFKQ